MIATSPTPSARCGRPTLRVVVDTSVWVSGLIVPDSPPGRVLQAVREGRLEAVASWELAEEIIDVLHRPTLSRHEMTEADTSDVLVLLAPLLPRVDVEAPLRDPRDAPVVHAAIAARADAIVSGDRDLLEEEAIRAYLTERGVALHSPAALLALIGP